MKYFQIVLLAIIGVTCLMCTHKHKCCDNKNSCDKKEVTIIYLDTVDSKMDSTIVSAPETIKIDSLLSLSKGACFGKCPVYNLLITQSGELYLENKMFMDKLGKFKGQLSSIELKKVLKNIADIKYFELEQYYPKNQKYFISDLPNTNTAVYMDDRVHKIFNNNSAPNSLMNFEKFIVELVINHGSLTIDNTDSRN